MRLGLVADWLTTTGGAERTLAEFSALWPESPIYSTVHRPESTQIFRDTEVRTSRLQSLYRIVGHHQLLLPLMPRAVEDIDLRGFDVILSSSHAVGKGVVPPSSAVHVCYCHTPMRYAWEMERQYLKDFRIPKMFQRRIRKELMRLRRWDLTTAKRVDTFLANSRETAARIDRIYGRKSIVISPPVRDVFSTVNLVPMSARKNFIAVGRLVPYKRFDLLIEWANAHKLPLTIVGRGQEEPRLRAMAGPTVTFHGHASDDELPAMYASARAALFPVHEDAGIVPREAQACGTPVIAYGKGGVLDSVTEDVTGVFFDEQTMESLHDALARFEKIQFDPTAIRKHADQFSAHAFRSKIKEEVMTAWEAHRVR